MSIIPQVIGFTFFLCGYTSGAIVSDIVLGCLPFTIMLNLAVEKDRKPAPRRMTFMIMTIMLSAVICPTFAHPTLMNPISPPSRRTSFTGGGLDVPITPRRIPSKRRLGLNKRDHLFGSVGTGNNVDLLYTVPIEFGNEVMAVNLDTGSSDLWVISDTCTINSCEGSNAPRYPTESMRPAGADVELFYGDSKTGTFAGGSVALETVCVAGMAMRDQQFLIANDTTNEIVQFETSGIFGLSFPSASRVQEVTTKKRPDDSTDGMLNATDTHGPLVARMALTGALESPMFTVTLQRNTIDLSGEGLLSIGKLPDGVDNSTLTWVPVRLYKPEEGGMVPPSYAPDEIYPYRWEIDIEGVYIDGILLPASRIPANKVDSRRTSALLDTGNSLLRGPADVVNNILGTVSQSFNPRAQYPLAALPCNIPHNLAFQIGGNMFPIDPRDFIGQLRSGDAVTCQADNIVPTDAPSIGSLFRWSLGAPFFRSNMVAFYYGNLTHPSVDPPRVGIRSNVPANAGDLLQQAVKTALKNGGNFPHAMLPAPTDSVSGDPVFLNPDDNGTSPLWTAHSSPTQTAKIVVSGVTYTPLIPTTSTSTSRNLVSLSSTLLIVLFFMVHFT